MGYSTTDDFEAQKKILQKEVEFQGRSKAMQSHVPKQIKEGLCRNITRFTVTDLIPQELTKRASREEHPATQMITWFLSGMFADFFDDWTVSMHFKDFGTEDFSIFVDFKPIEKKKPTPKEPLDDNPNRDSIPHDPTIPDPIIPDLYPATSIVEKIVKSIIYFLKKRK